MDRTSFGTKLCFYFTPDSYNLDRTSTRSSIFTARLLQAKPKSANTRDKHSFQPQLHVQHQQTHFQGTCIFPRCNRMKKLDPEQTHEKTMLLRKRNAETWIVILAHLHRYYSQLFQKTAAGHYQEEHVTNILSSYNQTSTARHLQVWQRLTEWWWTFRLPSCKY